MDTATLFDIVQTPIIGAIGGFVVYRQLLRQGQPRALPFGILAGVIGAVLYGLIKFVFLRGSA
jgi:uncharacterized membrane protein YeaQ/YmgE (transglycosylase-associated protein family)